MWPWSKKQKIQKEIEFPEERKNGAEIIFSVVEGKVNVEMYWYSSEDGEIETSMDFGQLLSDVNSGTYVESIFKIFNEYIEQHPEEKNFISDTILTWSEANIIKQEELEKQILEEVESDDKPLIEPLRVFRQSGIFKE